MPPTLIAVDKDFQKSTPSMVSWIFLRVENIFCLFFA